MTHLALMLFGAAMSAAGAADAGGAPVGVWRGTSTCATAAASCADEQVIYTIGAIPERTDAVLIRADKIVNGQTITMGSGPWQYDQSKGTLTWETASRIWRLTIRGKEMEGILTLPGNVVFRRVRLRKDE